VNSSEHYRFDLLTPHHDRAAFSCGEPSLDNYFKTRASQDMKRDLARCYVLSRDDTVIVGYYTLSAYAVQMVVLPPDVVKTSGRYEVVPAVLIGRLAVDQRFQGRKMGAVLLVDALRRATRAEVGIKLIIVDALNEAAARFYKHFGFCCLEDTERRLFLPASTARQLFSE
jgi:GNAT superfamily N-acetyltransferase